jgi:hypothetical protein
MVTVIAVVLTPAVAMACRITNATPWEDNTHGGDRMYAWFSCGHSCGSYFNIGPGSYVNTKHGQGGQVQACTGTYTAAADGEAIYYREVGTVSVSGNGEARFKWPPNYYHQIGETFHWDVYDSNNNLVKSVDHGVIDATQDPGGTECWAGSA